MKTTYKIEITKIDVTDITVIKNFVTEEKPIQIKENPYGGKEFVYEKKYETKECASTEKVESIILAQEVETLNLADVIKAINGL